jgi:hypothetical protein
MGTTVDLFGLVIFVLMLTGGFLIYWKVTSFVRKVATGETK